MEEMMIIDCLSSTIILIVLTIIPSFIIYANENY